jgi:hypothetical protein
LGRALGKRDKLSNFLFLPTVRAYKVTSDGSCKGHDVPPDLTVAAQMLATGIQQLLCPCNIKSQEQRWAKGRLSTFDLYPGGGGHGVQGQICHILTPVSYESLPAPSGNRFPHFEYIHLGAGGGSDIRSMSSIRPICKYRCPPLHKSRAMPGPRLQSAGHCNM